MIRGFALKTWVGTLVLRSEEGTSAAMLGPVCVCAGISRRTGRAVSGPVASAGRRTRKGCAVGFWTFCFAA